MIHKVGHKTRRGRRKNPEHKPHRKPLTYSRQARLLKQRLALTFAPTVEDFGLSDPQVASNLRPHGCVALRTNSGRADSHSAARASHGGTP